MILLGGGHDISLPAVPLPRQEIRNSCTCHRHSGLEESILLEVRANVSPTLHTGDMIVRLVRPFESSGVRRVRPTARLPLV
jgi:hypothetical protein